jgi:hypothetical protein
MSLLKQLEDAPRGEDAQTAWWLAHRYATVAMSEADKGNIGVATVAALLSLGYRLEDLSGDLTSELSNVAYAMPS